MSYCRWSSDHYRCDLYVYESDRGYETHVATRRINADPPAELVAMPVSTADEWVKAYMAERDWYDGLKNAEGDIPDELWLDLSTVGPEAGESYIDATAAECAARLRALRARGFNMPDSAIEELEREAQEAPDAE